MNYEDIKRTNKILKKENKDNDLIKSLCKLYNFEYENIDNVYLIIPKTMEYQIESYGIKHPNIVYDKYSYTIYLYEDREIDKNYFFGSF